MSTIVINFTNTKKDETPTSKLGVYIDYNGSITGTGTSITVRGGDNTDSATRSDVYPSGFYLTDGQRVALTRILRKFAKQSDQLTISSSNGDLEDMCSAIYRNFC